MVGRAWFDGWGSRQLRAALVAAAAGGERPSILSVDPGGRFGAGRSAGRRRGEDSRLSCGPAVALAKSAQPGNSLARGIAVCGFASE